MGEKELKNNMKNQLYACLECGHVHKEIILKERDDIEAFNGPPVGHIPAFHGCRTYRVCPACKYKQLIKSEKDK